MGLGNMGENSAHRTRLAAFLCHSPGTVKPDGGRRNKYSPEVINNLYLIVIVLLRIVDHSILPEFGLDTHAVFPKDSKGIAMDC